MKELTFALNLKNRLSAPLGRAQQSVDKFSIGTSAALKRIGGGAFGVWGTAKALTGLIKPADVVQSALNELSTRNVSGDTLKAIRREAAQFSTEFGVSAVDFIGSVTEIRSALGGLSDAELPRVARATNTLAVAMKSTGADAAGYISTLASHFTSELDRVGNVAFAENIASKTAWLVQNTGQDLARIQALLQGAKGTGTGYGVGIDEQLAVLGNLGNSLGSNAGGVYDAFLKNAKSGAKALGVSLTDAQGQLLAFPDILDRLQAKFGDTVAGNIPLQEKLNKAFGKGSTALIRSWGTADKLRKQIKELAGTQGLAGANSMADKMADIWNRLDQSGNRIKTAFGSALLPVFEPAINKVIQLSSAFARWLEMFPNITRWLGYVGTAIAVVTALTSIFALWTGVKAVAGLLGMGRAFSILNLSLLPTRIGLLALGVQAKAFMVWSAACKVATLAWSAALGVGAIAMKIYGAATMFAGVATQILLSPITLVVLAIAALAAGIWYAVSHWDELKAAIMDSAPFQFISGVLDSFGTVAGTAVEKVKGVFTGLWSWLRSTTMSSINWLIGKLNKIPGVNIDALGGDVEMEPPKLPPVAGLNAPQFNEGGAGKTLSSSTAKTDNSRTIGQMNVYPQNRETLDSLLESRELYAG
ncbi:phage tail tape measure protein [Enterobacter sichuanensis]|uniref:phage tail tape measure protein n=1 Tax=Enterobacter sichuanensis TaxID=2071710 RepID=UPI002DB7C28D|nr:phage tail tape measure protein [Enterobacter sichuanensis]MEB5958812.1 phage tail tape measure protein [Enterobacter sichuanensis]